MCCTLQLRMYRVYELYQELEDFHIFSQLGIIVIRNFTVSLINIFHTYGLFHIWACALM